MVYGFQEEMIGKRIWAYIPHKDGTLEQRAGFIAKFIRFESTDPMYLIKYDGIDMPHAAQPEWLILEPQ
jgi:hypothetical protein